ISENVSIDQICGAVYFADFQFAFSRRDQTSTARSRDAIPSGGIGAGSFLLTALILGRTSRLRESVPPSQRGDFSSDRPLCERDFQKYPGFGRDGGLNDRFVRLSVHATEVGRLCASDWNHRLVRRPCHRHFPLPPQRLAPALAGIAVSGDERQKF